MTADAGALGARRHIRAYGLSDSMRNPGEIEAMKTFVSAGLESGALKPMIAKVYKFDEMIEANNHVGKVVAVI
jgi:NADPH:quinone reductase-like Zn-dependent oxidoreductase